VFAELLSRLGAALDDAEIGYMVVGGQAVLVHGEPRLTRDIDLTIAGGQESVPGLLAVLAQLGLRPLPIDPIGFAAETMVLPAVDDTSGIRVDLILSWTPFEREAIERAETVSLDGLAYRVATAADLVVLKVLAGRPRDLEDVRGILIGNPDLDVRRIERWLRSFADVIDHAESPLTVFRAVLRSARGDLP